MKESFIPYVQEKRRKIDDRVESLKTELEELTDAVCTDAESKRIRREKKNELERLLSKNKHAVLVVDGHKSRYDPETFDMLHDADIDLVIIPAHTSHILQPLDLRLNGLVKEEFRKAWVDAIPEVLLATVTLKPKKSNTTTSEPQELEFSKAEYDRVHVVSAIRNAIPRALTPSNILSAWKTAHLYPFQRVPNYSKEKEEENFNELRHSTIHSAY